MDKEIPQKRTDATIAHLSFWSAPVLLFLVAVIIRVAFVAKSSGDFNDYVSHWFDHFSVYGWDGFIKPPGNYSMPYLFLLAPVAQLVGVAPTIVLVKSISVFFDGILACSVKSLVLSVTGDSRRAWIAFFGILLLPTVVLNSSAWGQCDSIYTSFIVLGIGALISSKWSKAGMWLSLAFSFKMQALFIVPFLFWMWCASGRPPLRCAFIVPVVFLLTVAPRDYTRSRCRRCSHAVSKPD